MISEERLRSIIREELAADRAAQEIALREAVGLADCVRLPSLVRQYLKGMPVDRLTDFGRRELFSELSALGLPLPGASKATN